MEYRYYPPSVSLVESVRTILSIEHFVSGDSLPILPQGTAALVCLVEDEVKVENRDITLLLYTKSIQTEVLQVYPNYSLIAFFFHPFMAGPLFGIQAKNIAGQPKHLREWSVKKTEHLLKKLKKTQTNGERIALLNSFLHEQFMKNRAACEIVRHATDRLVGDPSLEVLPELLSDLQISERTLQRVFKKYIGLSPGQFRRLCQFHSAFHQLKSREFGSLSDVAYDQGYADQSHFIRSFREFTRKNPGDYVKSGLSDPTK